MRFDVTMPSTQTGALDAQASRLLTQAKAAATSTSGLTSTGSTSKEDAKIDKAGKDFESILLGSWLQQAEQSFAKVPGGDGQDEDDDSGKDQFQGIAMQALAGSLTASGGIGIAKMITDHLHASDRGKADQDPESVASNSTKVTSTK